MNQTREQQIEITKKVKPAPTFHAVDQNGIRCRQLCREEGTADRNLFFRLESPVGILEGQEKSRQSWGAREIAATGIESHKDGHAVSLLLNGTVSQSGKNSRFLEPPYLGSVRRAIRPVLPFTTFL